MKYQNIREEELKNKVGQDYFSQYDTTKIIGNIDFTVTLTAKNNVEEQSLLWAEAKTGNFDLISMFAQLILTIGKARTFDKNLPPAFLGAFDFQKIAFVPYEKVQHLFFKNDFNWNVTSSNHETKEFKEIKSLIEGILVSDRYEYEFGKDDKELLFFIKNNLATSSESGKILIDKNNFVPIYLRWLEEVKPLINFDFTEGKKLNIVDSDFYLADLFVDDHDTATSDDDTALKEELFVVFKNGRYEIAKENLKSLFNASIDFKDKAAYEQFWKRYKRPPVNEFHNYIVERRDLLVPQDIRERKGAFFTPRQWVELSQQYIADVLGKNWQDEYYVWDCAAGTGNLLAGLTNKYNIWASTLDQADVKVMHDRIEHGANLLESHVFQFDFLNDDFSKLPQGLQDIVNDKEKRKKLVMYINPPYAEASDRATVISKGENKTSVATEKKVYEEFNKIAGTAARELFTQFFLRIYQNIPNAKLASFSTLKYVNAQNFNKFRNYFKAEFQKGFICPANSFDNVKGKFPIGFLIWNLEDKHQIKNVKCDIYDHNAIYCGKKSFFSIQKKKYIIDWLRNYYDKNTERIAFLRMQGTDMQNNQGVFFTNNPSENDFIKHLLTNITNKNVIQMSIYLAVRHCIQANWLNDRDQFLFPNKGWEQDKNFQNDCLAFALFHSQNKISYKGGVNHWIPFTEYEVGAREKFASNFMTDFINGKDNPLSNNIANEPLELFGSKKVFRDTPLVFSPEAKAVFDVGRELWKYYHAQKDANPNASLYDIREYFQGRNDKGRMNSKSSDGTYTKLIALLREKLNLLADKIAPKVYEYEFLKQ